MKQRREDSNVEKLVSPSSSMTEYTGEHYPDTRAF